MINDRKVGVKDCNNEMERLIENESNRFLITVHRCRQNTNIAKGRFMIGFDLHVRYSRWKDKRLFVMRNIFPVSNFEEIELQPFYVE